MTLDEVLSWFDRTDPPDAGLAWSATGERVERHELSFLYLYPGERVRHFRITLLAGSVVAMDSAQDGVHHDCVRDVLTALTDDVERFDWSVTARPRVPRAIHLRGLGAILSAGSRMPTGVPFHMHVAIDDAEAML